MVVKREKISVGHYHDAIDDDDDDEEGGIENTYLPWQRERWEWGVIGERHLDIIVRMFSLGKGVEFINRICNMHDVYVGNVVETWSIRPAGFNLQVAPSATLTSFGDWRS